MFGFCFCWSVLLKFTWKSVFVFRFLKFNEDEIRGIKMILRFNWKFFVNLPFMFSNLGSGIPILEVCTCAQDILNSLWILVLLLLKCTKCKHYLFVIVEQFYLMVSIELLKLKFKEQSLRFSRVPWDISKILLEKYVFVLVLLLLLLLLLLLKFEEVELCSIKGRLM